MQLERLASRTWRRDTLLTERRVCANRIEQKNASKKCTAQVPRLELDVPNVLSTPIS